MDMIKRVRGMVSELLCGDKSGHGMDHTERVVRLAVKFAEAEGADVEVVTLAALLHDADDYKLVGAENAKGLVNTRRILTAAGVDKGVSEKVTDIIANMGYSKMLKGIRPKTIEGKVVSDADMCDAVGANGFVRTRAYGIKVGRPLFDRNVWPAVDIDADEYASKASSTCVCHCFEKGLRLRNYMMTKAGRKEIKGRHRTVVDFLRGLFQEEGAEEWLVYLEDFEKRGH